MNKNIRNILKFACCLLAVGTLTSMIAVGFNNIVGCILVSTFGALISSVVFDY